MSGSYEDLMGDEQDPKDHPVHNVPQATQHYAGEVVQMVQPSNTTARALNSQIKNDESIRNIANQGAKGVDTTNLAKRIVKP